MPANQRLIVIALVVVVGAIGFVAFLATQDNGASRQIAPEPATSTTATTGAAPAPANTITTRGNVLTVTTKPE